MSREFSAILVSACLAFAGDAGITREGVYWVRTTSGSLPVAPSGIVRIRSRGAVTVRGVASPATYTLKTRVRAASEAEARRLLSELRLQTSALRGGASLVLTHPNRPAASAELSVGAPSEANIWIETQQGDVQAFDLQSNVYVQTGAGEIRMDRIGRNVHARTAGGEVRLGSIGGGIQCFSGGGSIEAEHAGGESWFETAGGNIRIGEVGGPVHASTAGGNVSVGRAHSSVIARSAGGRIEVQEAGGLVMAGNSGGSIQVGRAQSVRLEATGGSIRLRGSSGALRAVSDVGSILAELIPGVRLQDSTLSTGNGDITVFIPSNTPLTIRAWNETDRVGRIVSEFPEIFVRQMQQQSRMLAEGILNGGGPVLQLTSTGGTIYLRRVRQ